MWLTTHPEEDDMREDDNQACTPQRTQRLCATFPRRECSDKKRSTKCIDQIELNKNDLECNQIK